MHRFNVYVAAYLYESSISACIEHKHKHNLHATYAVICVHMLPRTLFPYRKEKRTFVMHLYSGDWLLSIYIIQPGIMSQPGRG